MNLISVSYEHEDIMDTMDTEELYEYCNRVYKAEDCSSADDMMESLMCVEYFPNVTFHELLEKFLAEQNKDIKETVRAYMPYKKGFVMTHGIGYDWKSADLLGGSANGKAWRQFEDWLETNGYTLVSQEDID